MIKEFLKNIGLTIQPLGKKSAFFILVLAGLIQTPKTLGANEDKIYPEKGFSQEGLPLTGLKILHFFEWKNSLKGIIQKPSDEEFVLFAIKTPVRFEKESQITPHSVAQGEILAPTILKDLHPDAIAFASQYYPKSIEVVGKKSDGPLIPAVSVSQKGDLTPPEFKKLKRLYQDPHPPKEEKGVGPLHEDPFLKDFLFEEEKLYKTWKPDPEELTEENQSFKPNPPEEELPPPYQPLFKDKTPIYPEKDPFSRPKTTIPLLPALPLLTEREPFHFVEESEKVKTTPPIEIPIQKGFSLQEEGKPNPVPPLEGREKESWSKGLPENPRPYIRSGNMVIPHQPQENSYLPHPPHLGQLREVPPIPANPEILIFRQGENLSLHCSGVTLPGLISRVCEELSLKPVYLKKLANIPIQLSLQNLESEALFAALARTGSFAYSIQEGSFYVH